ncbi:helix-turn-helix domain-containing protein [Rothia sp. P5766]|uniref:helix-turn-helix domain-containing protein n=1 Tax=Rothia sp. P5766 TaxID=3402656 RepID=UPI003AE09197
MQHRPTTGLTATQFATLITAHTSHLTWIKPAEKPRRLTLTQALKITLISYRHNLTQETLAHLFEVSQPTISRTISTIERALEKVLTPVTRPSEREPESTWLPRGRWHPHPHLELVFTR